MNTTTTRPARILDTDSYDRVLIDVRGVLFWTETWSEGAVRMMLAADNAAETILDRLYDAGIDYEVANEN
jgi:hypothetical protein